MTDTTLTTKLPSSLTSSLTPLLSELSEADLVKSINVALDSMASAFRNSARRAIEVGELLNEQKKRVGHGNFEAWLSVNCKLSPSTARRYMNFADHRVKIEAALNNGSITLNGKTVNVTDLSLSAAKRLIAPNPKSSGSSSEATETDTETDSATSDIDASDTSDTSVEVDPLGAIHELENELLGELKTLKRNNHAKAKEVASNIVRLLEAADLV